MTMRTAADFDAFYAKPDPWGVASYSRRDRALARLVAPLIRGKSLLELGCGEGHLTRAVFNAARWIQAVDISPAAIRRAPKLPNAEFHVGDQRELSLKFYDVIASIETLSYLSSYEKEQFFARLAAEHRGLFLMMTPISGGEYFTHQGAIATFRDHGIRLIRWHNVYVNRKPGAHILAAVASRLPGITAVAPSMPKHFVCHRLYVTEVGP